MRSSIRTVSCPLVALLLLSAARRASAAPDLVTPLSTPASPASSATPATLARPPIEVRDVVWGSRHGDLRHKPVPFQGSLILDDPALFRLLGREDLVRAYEGRTAAREVVTAGALLALFGSAFALAEARPTLDCSGSDGCRTQRSDGAFGAGVALLVVSTALIIADATMSSSPISDDEKLRLIDQYNASARTVR